MSDVDISIFRNDRNLKPVFYNDKCDKYDYLSAVGCGAIAGLVDIFLVGSNRDFGRYAGEKGEMNVCFISNNDITGGNSG